MAITLAIEHVEGSNPATFRLTRRADGKSLEPISIVPPYGFPVSGQPNSDLMRELRWYLEKFLEYPFHPETLHAEHVLDALKDWGRQAFKWLFDRRNAGGWLDHAEIIQITSDDAGVLSWPWEALFDPQVGAYLAHQRRIERRVNKIGDPPAMDLLPKDRVNILLVVARPFEGDVRYRSIARPLVELIRDKGLPAHVDVLRPPTFKQLREHLKAKPNYYHVLHFDGHGAYRGGGGSLDQQQQPHSPHQFHGQQGCLIFEDDMYQPDRKSAADLNALLHEYAVPAVVLNACQSGMLDLDADNAFASVATSLLQSGMRSVVAMAYSLYVSGARVFLPVFYQRLFEDGSVAEAVRAGRQGMLASKDRVCVRGQFPLEDWLLPVLYQQAPLEFDFVDAKPAEPVRSRLPAGLLEHREPYGFIGRDGPILEMERALHRQAPVILLQGLGGVGKTSLARGFLKWLDDTGGLDVAMWFDFRDIRTAESVINRTGEMFYGDNFGIAKEKFKLLGDAFLKVRVLIVWDNFESAQANLTLEDRAELRRFLEAIRGGRGKVIITSRSQEVDWLGPELRFDLAVRGLDGEERWEYFDTIVHELGLKVRRDDPELKGLVDMLAGHPLAMRVVVPRLAAMPAAKIAEALRTNIAALGLNENEEQGRLFGTLRFVEEGLAPELRPLLGLVGLHESYVTAGLLEAMAEQVDPAWTRPVIELLMAALASAGLMRDIGQATYEMHPLLTSYLRSKGEASESCRRGFVRVMSRLADVLAPKHLQEKQPLFKLHGASFRLALGLAKVLSMDQEFAALTQSLAVHAQHTRNFADAGRLFVQLAAHGSSKGDSGSEAGAYHQLGMIAQEQRDFARARNWYLKSLAISEKLDLYDAASTYHQLGALAEEQLDFPDAEVWYLKSLAIKEKQSNLSGAATTYGQLGILAQKRSDLDGAKTWYLKSLEISNAMGNPYITATTHHQLGMIAAENRDFDEASAWYFKSLAITAGQENLAAASTYHQLGMMAEEQQDFVGAKPWYLKSLSIKEKQGDPHGAAITYHQLGMIAEEQREFSNAQEWYLKSLAIDQRQGNLHGAASTCGQLGILAGLQECFEDCGRWFSRSIAAFLTANDKHLGAQAVANFLVFYKRASSTDKSKLEAIWHEAGLGPFPQEHPPTQ